MNTIIWLVRLILFLGAEAATVTMVSLWFAAGSLAALIVPVTGGPLGLQLFVALAVSALLLACLRPVVRKHFIPGLTKTNVDAVIGTHGVVTAEIDNLNAVGQVKIGGMEWTARSTSGANIPAGTRIQVDRIEGVKAFVSPAEVSEMV